MSAIAQGPVSGPALRLLEASRRIAPTLDSDKRPVRAPSRRQIGRGGRSIIVTNPAQLSTPRRHSLTVSIHRASTMKRTTLFATLAGALLVSATAYGISTAVEAPRSLMSPNDYSVHRKSIESDTRAAVARCRDLEGLARDVCKAEARADDRVKKADLEAEYRGTVAAAADAKLARAKSHYDVAKARCGDQRGEDKLACLRTARDDKAKELAAAKLAAN
jgi:hypothetical protein